MVIFWRIENIKIGKRKEKDKIIGKWLWWLNPEELSIFEDIVKLGEPCKISTKYGAENYVKVTGAKKVTHVVCIYTSKIRKETVKEKLWKIGIKVKAYKLDRDTYEGKYSNKKWGEHLAPK
jgi:hypothetical protein